MKASDLGNLSLKELRSLQERVAAAIAEREVQDRAEVKAKLAEIASKAGFNVNELFGAARSKKGPAAAKFQNPKDPAQTWSGRGRKPNWLVEAAGDIERFRI